METQTFGSPAQVVEFPCVLQKLAAASLRPVTIEGKPDPTGKPGQEIRVNRVFRIRGRRHGIEIGGDSGDAIADAVAEGVEDGEELVEEVTAGGILAEGGREVLQRRGARIENAQPVDAGGSLAVAVKFEAQPEISARRTLDKTIPVAVADGTVSCRGRPSFVGEAEHF